MKGLFVQLIDWLSCELCLEIAVHRYLFSEISATEKNFTLQRQMFIEVNPKKSKILAGDK